VVVCSNGSTDTTDEVVRRWMSVRPQLRYFANERNFGIDENIRRVAIHATGTFVRLLSDDDVLVPGSIVRLMRVLRRRPDVGFLFLNAGTLVEEGGAEGVQAPVLALDEPADADGLLTFGPAEFVQAVGVWISFVSSFVVRRELWVDGSDDSAYVGTDLFLSYKAIDVVAAAGRGCVLPEIAVAARPHFSGSYRIFRAFGPEWRKLLLSHAVARGLDPAVMDRTWSDSVRTDLFPRIGRALLSGTFDAKERRIVLDTLADRPALRWRALVLMTVPPRLLQAAKRLRKQRLRGEASSHPFVPLAGRG
jgi:glycosyltransferase involved in cell wall biosynthesis